MLISINQAMSLNMLTDEHVLIMIHAALSSVSCNVTHIFRIKNLNIIPCPKWLQLYPLFFVYNFFRFSKSSYSEEQIHV